MDYQLIIIGAGPAGLAMASEAILSGLKSEEILVLEKSNSHNESIRRYYPEEKLVTANYKGNDEGCIGRVCLTDMTKDQAIEFFDDLIKRNSLNILHNEFVSSISKKDGIFQIKGSSKTFTSKACAIAIGKMGRPNTLKIPIASSIRKKVIHSISSDELNGKRVLVVGGGDSAGEYADNLIQRGCNVTLSYRKKVFERMNDENQQIALNNIFQKKMNVLYESNLKEIQDKNGSLKVLFQEDNFKENYLYDYVVFALGGASPKQFLKDIGIEFEGRFPIISKNYESNLSGLFVLGDLSARDRGGSINFAFNSAHIAMKDICTNYLQCKI